MSVLILHHIEPMWEHSYNKMGTSIDEIANKVKNHIRRKRKPYSEVILTRFEETDIPDDLQDIADDISTVETYGYGWEANMFDDPSEYCEGGTHSEVVHIAPWMKELPKKNIYIAGAFDGECIEDLEIALTYLKIKYKRIEELIV